MQVRAPPRSCGDSSWRTSRGSPRRVAATTPGEGPVGLGANRPHSVPGKPRQPRESLVVDQPHIVPGKLRRPSANLVVDEQHIEPGQEKLWKFCMEIRNLRNPGKTVENLHGDSESLGEICQIQTRPCQTPQKSSQSLRYNSQPHWIKIRVGQGKGGRAKP